MSTDQEPASPSVLTTIEASVAHIVLNRPQARNAITVALATGLAAALRAAAGQARVIVIRGAGGHFCAGGDFGEMSRLRPGGPDALRPLFEAFGAACELIGDLPVPVVARSRVTPWPAASNSSRPATSPSPGRTRCWPTTT